MYIIVKGTRRHRYISFRITSAEDDQKITETEFMKALRQQINQLFSQTTNELGLRIIKFNGNTGIIKCNHREKERTIQLLQSLKKINLKPVTVITFITSGTIRGLKYKKTKSSSTN